MMVPLVLNTLLGRQFREPFRINQTAFCVCVCVRPLICAIHTHRSPARPRET